jgi:hypothetical protein
MEQRSDPAFPIRRRTQRPEKWVSPSFCFFKERSLEPSSERSARPHCLRLLWRPFCWREPFPHGSCERASMPSPALAALHAVRPCIAADSAHAGETAAKPRAFVPRIRRQPNLRQSNRNQRWVARGFCEYHANQRNLVTG